MNEVFNFQENGRYSLRSGIHLASRNMHTAHSGTDTIPSLYNLLRILVLLKFVRVSTTLVHIILFLKNREKNLKEHLEHFFFTQLDGPLIYKKETI